MTTLREFEDELRRAEQTVALAILDGLKQRDRKNRTMRPARRMTGKKMNSELARRIVDLSRTTDKTQQKIAFELGVNQGRVNEVLKHGKWLNDDPQAPEAKARDEAKARNSARKSGALAPKAKGKVREVQLGFDGF